MVGYENKWKTYCTRTCNNVHVNMSTRAVQAIQFAFTQLALSYKAALLSLFFTEVKTEK